MKTKNFSGKRVLSLVLTFLVVLSLVPMASISAYLEPEDYYRFIVSRDVQRNDVVCREEEYFRDLHDAIRYAENGYDGTPALRGTIELYGGYTVYKGEDYTIPANFELEIESFNFENYGTLRFASRDNLEMNSHYYKGDGKLYFGEDGYVFLNDVYYDFAGEYNADKNNSVNLADYTNPTYFTAGEGYMLYSAGENPVLTLNNATVYSNDKGHGDSFTAAIRYSAEDNLTIKFSGNNKLYSKSDYAVYGITTDNDLVLEGVGNKAVLNIETEDSENYGYLIACNDLTIKNGTVNLNSGSAQNDSSYGISVQNMTVAEDAVVNVSVGDGVSLSAAVILTGGKLTVDGVLNTDFGTANVASAGLVFLGSSQIDGAGTLNALVLELEQNEEIFTATYTVSGDVVIDGDFATCALNSASSTITLAEGTSLTIPAEYIADFSALGSDDLNLEGKLVIDGTVLLSEADPLIFDNAEISGNGKIIGAGVEIPVAKLYNNVAGHSISLSDNISVNYFVNVKPSTLNDANSKFVFTVPNSGSTYTVEIPVTDGILKDGYYVYTCEVAAKELTSAISAKIVTSNGEFLFDDYSVVEYAEKILSNATVYAKEQKLVKALLNYGTQAQIYFDHNIENPANSILEEADRDFGTYNFEKFAPVISGEQTGIEYYGSTLTLNSEIAIKHYFIVEDEENMPVFKVNGTVETPTKNGNMYVIKIDDIIAHSLDNIYTIQAGNLTVEYGAFSYAYQASMTDKETLKNTVNALYAYNLAADDYI